MTTTLLVCSESFGLPEVVVEGNDYRHLFRAKRLRLGDALRLVDGCGNARRAEVVAIDRHHATLRAGKSEPPRLAVRDVDLWVAAIRPERAGWLVEKGTELGIRRIVFYDCDRCQRRLEAAHRERFGRVAKAALQQSGGARLPELETDRSLREVLEEPPHGVGLDSFELVGCTVVLDTPQPDDGGPGASRQRFGEVAPASFPGPELALRQEPGPVRLVVGPEGGFSDEERLALRQKIEQSASAQPTAEGGTWRRWTLGELVLRVETAAIVGAALALQVEADRAV